MFSRRATKSYLPIEANIVSIFLQDKANPRLLAKNNPQLKGFYAIVSSDVDCIRPTPCAAFHFLNKAVSQIIASCYNLPAYQEQVSQTGLEQVRG